MSSTVNPQETRKCPNCGVESQNEVGEPGKGDWVGIFDCDNENCAVSRFYGRSYYDRSDER